ncbi:hypothetical protein [Pseudomonas aeruginosa]|uniref:hypothetical protein n=1 Tax=Pseudomonas aeruginosa TaxID=287 RepID=UPI000A43B738|nr:hypothetical protein [Pseudomonas aeruginosa]MBH4056966.1 hypothetical protein [Pseudomonas aeruginosa]MBI8596798.1 hypothetical protein [Pseudomonas aeruginosa]MBX6043432.1 hypothetical protein [Pseudomonas aeruginosa]MCO3917415.1 hypothetical protein [Pseudomonas aeruginosa]MDY1174567.1 hypothetical protein [Pseudomonas aeruginosa]
MKRLSVLLILAIGFLCSRGYAQSELEPCDNEFSGEYYARVDRVIAEAVGQRAQLKLTTIPSFEPESGVRLVGTDVYFVRFLNSLWAEATSFDEAGYGHTDYAKPKITTEVRHAPLAPGLAKRVEQVFLQSIANTKKSDDLRLDGVTYRFSADQNSCGATWSPDPESHSGHLVGLVKLLERHAGLEVESDLRNSEKSISQALDVMKSE